MERELWPVLYHPLQQTAKEVGQNGSRFSRGSSSPLCPGPPQATYADNGFRVARTCPR